MMCEWMIPSEAVWTSGKSKKDPSRKMTVPIVNTIFQKLNASLKEFYSKNGDLVFIFEPSEHPNIKGWWKTENSSLERRNSCVTIFENVYSALKIFKNIKTLKSQFSILRHRTN